MLQSPTSSSWTRVSALEVLITRACDPSLHEPNYAAHIEVAEYINNKKANTPREAAMTIARLANNRNPHISMLALSLLDTLVQSCGYPFHLQISTKEFLNELVRRFPERPPPYPNAIMSRILELINTWKEGICVDSRWKEDLSNIRDMHRLLTFKGYRFRDFARPTQSQPTAANANLKSAVELEEEDRAAQSAKLQELIRRGTPRDLAAAQELMKSLAGADPEAKPDYKTQALHEINKLESKVVLMNEMLDNVDMERGEKFVEGDAYDQVAEILRAARPKLQKWASEVDVESHDSESLDTFLQMNDQINSVLNRYEAFKKGDYSFAANPIPAELSNAGSASAGTGLSLIDFDDSTNGTSATISTPTNTTTATSNSGGDLMGLFGAPAPAATRPSPLSSLSSLSHPMSNAMPVMESRIGLGLPGMHVGTPTPPIPSTFTPPNYSSPSSAPVFASTPPIGVMHGAGGAGMGMGMNSALGYGSPFGPSGNVGPRNSSPAPAAPHTPNYFSGPAGSGTVGVNLGMGMGVARMGTPSTPQTMQPMNAMGSMQSSQSSQPMQTQLPAQNGSSMSSQPPATQAKDPFADLAGLF
ncbi:VHS domain-containing protein [Lentinula edodes]|uniref:VHS domain-containing protein n=1 Tax=Lentinula lateritia TaxID=40482 RepID=A0A9W9DZ63_9AGAR|nr:VHS domain-containing protein [Lentinula edodes]